MKKDRKFLLKLLGLLILTLLYSPTLVVIRSCLFKEPMYLVSFFGSLMIIFYSTFISSSYIKKILNIDNRQKAFLKYIINFLFLLLILNIVFDKFYEFGKIRKYTEVIMYLALFLLANNKNKKKHWEIVEHIDIFVGTFNFLILNIMIFFMKLEIFDLLLTNIYLTTFGILILKNQLSIEDEIINKSSLSGAPKYINRFNLKIVSLVFLLFLILFTLKNILGDIFKKILIYMVKIMIAINGFLNKLLYSEMVNSIDIENQELDIVDGASPNVLIQHITRIIIITVLIVSFIYIMYRYGSKIIKSIKELIRNLIYYILRKKKDKNEFVFEGDYHDTVTSIRKEEMEKNRKTYEKNKNKVKLNYKYKKIKNYKKRIRYMYLIILHKMINYRKIVIKDSDTTNEIANKIKMVEFDKVTKTYNEIRYGNKVVSEDIMSDYENNFEEIYKELERK